MEPAETDHKGYRSNLMITKKKQDHDEDVVYETFDYDTYQLDHSMPDIGDIGITLSIGPIDEYNPPKQQELFRNYIMGQCLHEAYAADENPQWQCEAYIEQKPFLKEANDQKKLELSFPDDNNVEYWYVGSNEEYLMWRLRWSEYFDDPRNINWK